MSLKGIIKFLLTAAVGFGVYSAWPWRVVHHAPGVLVSSQPLQKAIAPKALPEVGGWKLTAVAEYTLRGRVLGTKRYFIGENTSLVPVDVSLGWGRMSDESVLSKFDLSMGNRFFYYEWRNQPAIPPEEIKVSAANNHIIAANADVRSAVRWLKAGQIVSFKGYLVNAVSATGGTWNSSLQRDDDGNGACELFYVESAKVE